MKWFIQGFDLRTPPLYHFILFNKNYSGDEPTSLTRFQVLKNICFVCFVFLNWGHSQPFRIGHQNSRTLGTISPVLSSDGHYCHNDDAPWRKNLDSSLTAPIQTTKVNLLMVKVIQVIYKLRFISSKDCKLNFASPLIFILTTKNRGGTSRKDKQVTL